MKGYKVIEKMGNEEMKARYWMQDNENERSSAGLDRSRTRDRVSTLLRRVEFSSRVMIVMDLI